MGSRPRSRASRRGGRTGGADARALGRGEIRVRPRAAVQRLLSRLPGPEGRTAGRPPVARGGDCVLPPAADPGPQSHGLRSAGAHVKPVIGITPCSRLDDYVESVRRAGGEPRVLSNDDDPAAVLAEVDGVLL